MRAAVGIAFVAGCAVGVAAMSAFVVKPLREERTRLFDRAAEIGAERDAAVGQRVRDANDLTARRDEAARLASELAKAKAEAESIAAERTKLQRDLASAEERIAALAPRGAAPRPKATFRFAEYGDAFDAVDWGSVALHTTAIVGPIREIADALLAGKPVPLQAAGEAQKHNGPLIQAVGAVAGTLSGTGPNGAYTHPAFQVNAIAAALDQIGMPLSAAQRTSVEDLGRRFTEEERARVATYGDTTFLMQKLVEEGALKDRFFDAVREVLAPAQLDALSPAPVRDRVAADLWSEGLLWATVTRPVQYAQRERFTEQVARTVGPLFKLDEVQRGKASAIVADWAGRMPAELADRKPDALERAGMAPADLVAVAAAETRTLVERIAADLNLSGDQLAAARRWGVVFFPVPAAAGDDEE